MSLAQWLAELGLGQYAAAFAENEIDFDVLGQLTDADLKELGVGSLGNRRRLLAAIAARAPGSATADLLPEISKGERRQVTVMFADLVGSTALSARMDPEDLREVLSGYQKCVADTVVRFGGFVAKYMGDGVLIYFGYPQAHEDDAERAVRAGLALVAAVGVLQTGAALQTRVGIATGVVVVGGLIGSGASREQAIVGETPNLAARLQGMAEPNEVVIAGDTRKLIGHLFKLEDLGPKRLKGIKRPVRVFVALRPSAVESRFEALHGDDLTALVGRKEELELLLRHWSKAKTGEGQIVLLSGEAGIGKSRLTAALLDKIVGESHTRLRYFCSPQHTDSAFYPIITRMERDAGLAHRDTPQMRLNKLDAMLAQVSTSKEDAALFAEMLSLPNDGRYPTLDLDSQRRRQRTLGAFIAHTEARARQNPVLMIFEDVHWIDPTSLEALSRAIDRSAALRVLLIVSFRPEFQPLWTGRPYVTALTINRLVPDDIDAMIDFVIDDKSLPANIRQLIIERSDGIPLFVEEMTKAALEAEGKGENRPAIAFPSSHQPVPASLHASLMARLDRLGSAKEVAQIGAVVGREFSHPLITALARKAEPELQSALDVLIEAGLLFRRGVPPHATYLFKHALVQNAAYGTLLREPRRALHGRIAETLEGQFEEIAESQPSLLARHYTEAGLIAKAAIFWGKAGQRSLERSALVEATGQLARALDQIATLPSTSALRSEQIKLQIGLANALMHTKGHATSDTKDAFDQARSLIERAEMLGEFPEDPLILFSILYGFWVANYAAFKGGVMRELATQFLTLAMKQPTTVPLMMGHRMMGTTLAFTGDVAEARTHLDQALALYDPVEHRLLTTRFGQDARVAILFVRSLALWVQGYPEGALADWDQALKHAREGGHAATLAYALNFTLMTLIHCGNYRAAHEQVDEIIALADEKGSPLWKALGMVLHGCVCAMTDKASETVEVITTGITALRSTGQTLWMPLFLCILARAYANLGRFDDATHTIDDAISTVKATKENWYEAEITRTAGEITIMSPQPDLANAETCFEIALSVARAQQAKSWELRAAMSMARLWRDRGKRHDARELLSSVYNWFTEGVDTLDLKKAKVLLEELAP